MHKNAPASFKAVLAAIGAVLLWCWSGVCFRKGADLMGSMAYVSLITGGGALTAVLLQYVRKTPLKSLIKLPPRVIISGFFGVAIYTIILGQAFAMAPESDLGQINIINYLWPVWVVILGIALLGGTIKPWLAISGILLGFSGVILSVGTGAIGRIPVSIIPHTLALCGGFLWALYSIYLKKWHIPEENAGTALHFSICALLAAAIALYMGQWQQMPSLSWPLAFWVIFGAVGPVGIAYTLWEYGSKNGPVIFIGSLAYFTPIGSSIIIGFVFKEALNPGLFAGGFLIAGGAWLVRAASKKADNNPQPCN